VASAVGGVRTLLRKHVELAKLEVGAAVSVRAAGAGMMLAAGVLAMFAFGFGTGVGCPSAEVVIRIVRDDA
jgi:Putative Actinobacterial Holin-X, holin superfamily III